MSCQGPVISLCCANKLSRKRPDIISFCSPHLIIETIFSCKTRHLCHGILHTLITEVTGPALLSFDITIPRFLTCQGHGYHWFLTLPLILCFLACQLAAKNRESTLFGYCFDLRSSGCLSNSLFTAILEIFIPSFIISKQSLSPASCWFQAMV